MKLNSPVSASLVIALNALSSSGREIRFKAIAQGLQIRISQSNDRCVERTISPQSLAVSAGLDGLFEHMLRDMADELSKPPKPSKKPTLRDASEKHMWERRAPKEAT